jgi:Fe-S-cluster-containing hydrogenase component 2
MYNLEEQEEGVKIAIVYFSGTNVTHTYAENMMKSMSDKGRDVGLVNVTPYYSRTVDFPIDEYDFFIFGFPVFSDFAPSVINSWIQTLEGKGKRCAQFFTYGARTTGYAHFHTKKLLEEVGFKVLLSAEFLGRHSFNVAGWQILPDRPDEGDFEVAQQYTDLVIEKISSKDPREFRLQKPFGYDQAIKRMTQKEVASERSWANPMRTTLDCVMCRDCETECPTSAFDADAGVSDPEKCIDCMRCAYICPDGVIDVDEQVKGFYENFKRYWHLTEEMMRSKQSKVISESWQAAS